MRLFNNTNMRTAMAYTNAVGDKVYPVIVDIKKGIKSTEEILFVSSDINTGILSVAFIQGNDTYNVEGAEVICSIMRPDTTTLEIPCNTVNGNTIEVPLGVNGTSQDGVYSFDFKVFKGGNKIVGTPIMNYSVSLSISNDLVVEEDDRLPVLTMLMTQVSELHDRTDEAVNKANTATEATKVATANAIEATNNANAVSERVSQETATAISEIKQDTANAIATMNQSTSTAISTMNQSTTDAIDSMNQNTTNAISNMTQKTDEALANMNQSTTDAVINMTQKTDEAVTRINDNLANVNNVVTTKVAELDNAKSDMTTTVTNKVNEVEGRFNALTASQQQSSEVIDARDGEVSLKARLDRDIEKANKELDKIKKLEESTVSTVETESDFTTVEATSNGYFEDVKLEGKTLVNLCDYSTTKFTSNYGDDRVLNKLVRNTNNCTVINNTSNILYADIFNSDNTYIKGITFEPNSVHYIDDKTAYINNLHIKRVSSDYVTIFNSNVVVLEGDHTQNPPSFFEGLKSVGQSATTSEGGADEIVVSSVKGDGNLFDGELEVGSYSEESGLPIQSINHRSINYININNSTEYYLKLDNMTLSPRVFYYDKNKKYISNELMTNSSIKKLTVPKNAYFIKFHVGNISLDENIYVGKYPNNIRDYVNPDKKRLLYYNDETQTWEKPILRQWDSIEKHADGKYYYHQRSAEIVLNGSEDWYIAGISSGDFRRFQLTHVGICHKPYDIVIISDKFKSVTNKEWTLLEKKIEADSTSIYITTDILTVEGFKQWLQANNVTVVYQLAQEKVYECTNIDLITYANETNYIVECGAIAPKSTLKVHNNISNVVKILQEKVSLLENKFIEGLKQVLAGDMYSLAELLYPEDFEEVETENNIMLLPLE